MIDINIHNYEEYVIDYLEGRLSSEEEDAFVNFLIDHPEIAEEMEGLDEITLPEAEQVQSFPGKQALLKKTGKEEDASLHFDELCVAKLEGDLSRTEETEFDIMLEEDPYKAKAFSYYKKTKLRPDLTIRFQGKPKLKKPVFHQNRTLVWLSAAASVALLVGLFFMTGEDFSRRESLDVEKIASIQKQQEEKQDISQEEVKRENRETTGPKRNEKTNNDELTNTSKKVVKTTSSKETDEVVTTENKIQPEVKKEPIEDLERLAESRAEPLKLKNDDLQPALKTDIRTAIYFSEKTEDPLNKATKTAVQGINKLVFNKGEGHPASERISFWDIAGLGVKGINRLTGSEMELKKSYDEEGNVKSLAFNSKAISFTHKTNK